MPVFYNRLGAGLGEAHMMHTLDDAFEERPWVSVTVDAIVSLVSLMITAGGGVLAWLLKQQKDAAQKALVDVKEQAAKDVAEVKAEAATRATFVAAHTTLENGISHKLGEVLQALETLRGEIKAAREGLGVKTDGLADRVSRLEGRNESVGEELQSLRLRINQISEALAATSSSVYSTAQVPAVRRRRTPKAI